MHKYTLFAQSIGGIAVVFSLLIFQVNDRRKMLNLGVLAAVFWTIHFYLLGAQTGAALNAVGGVRDFVVGRVRPSRDNAWILGLLVLVAAVVTYLTWQGLISLLPFAACCLTGVSFWSGNTTLIRRLFLVVPPLWFAYNFVSHSYPGMLIECLIVFSNLVAQIRFDQKPSRKNRLIPLRTQD